MRLNINLATQPYEDARRFAIAWSSIIGVLLLLVIVLTVGVVKRWQHYRQMSADLNREHQILQDLNAKEEQGLAILNLPDNHDVRDKSEFINSLIHRKQVSWTLIFTDLEQLMPSNLRVFGVEPVEKDDQVLVRMLLGGDSRDKAAELVRRMETSRVFRSAQIINESNSQTSVPGQRGATTDNMRFEIIAEYVPGVPLTKPVPEKTAEKTEDGGGQ